MIYGKLNADGRLTDIRYGPQQIDGTWPDGSQDVELMSMPADSGPWGYDSVNQLAVPAAKTAIEKTADIPLPGVVIQALCVQDSARRLVLIPLAIQIWAAGVIDKVTKQVVATGVS